MNRRLFLSTVSGLAAIQFCPTLERATAFPGQKIVLEALAAEHMPLWAVLQRNEDLNGANIFELRHYSRPVRRHLDIFRRAGIRILASQSSPDGLTCLMAFTGLANREHTWSLLNTDLEWPGASLTQLSLFRRAQK